MLFDEQQFDLESYLYDLKHRIEKRSNFLFELMEKWREIYQNQINQYSEIFKNIHQEITAQFQSLNQEIETFIKLVIFFSMILIFEFSSKDPDPVKEEYYFQEINEFKRKLRQRCKQIDKYSNRYPIYSIPNCNSSILGTISLQNSIADLKLRITDDNTEQPKILEQVDDNNDDDTQSTDSDQTIHESSSSQTTPLTTLENIPNKKLLWSLHFKFVPQYISLYRQSILFASDRWGFVR